MLSPGLFVAHLILVLVSKPRWTPIKITLPAGERGCRDCCVEGGSPGTRGQASAPPKVWGLHDLRPVTSKGFCLEAALTAAPLNLTFKLRIGVREGASAKGKIAKREDLMGIDLGGTDPLTVRRSLQTLLRMTFLDEKRRNGKPWGYEGNEAY